MGGRDRGTNRKEGENTRGDISVGLVVQAVCNVENTAGLHNYSSSVHKSQYY